MLAQTPSPLTALVATRDADGALVANASRLDGQYAWCAWPDEGAAVAGAVDAGVACAAPDPALVGGRFAVVALGPAPANCSAEDAARALARAGAAGVVVAQRPGAALAVIGAAHADDDDDAAGALGGVVVTMVDADAGAALAAALPGGGGGGGNVTIALATRAAPGALVAIDAAGDLQEVGWEKYATARMLSWAAQFLAFRARLARRLAAPALVAPLFARADTSVALSVARAPLPDWALVRAQFARVELDVKLACEGATDADCPTWDHCAAPAAARRGARALGDGALRPAARARARARARAQVSRSRPSAGTRRRRARAAGGSRSAARRTSSGGGSRRSGGARGRWLTDVTSLAPALAAGACSFELQAAAGGWVVDASLRYSTRAAAADADDDGGGGGGGVGEWGVPFELLPLVWPNAQTRFDSPAYNANRTLEFTVPPGTARVALRALASGHGGCEFAPTSHHYDVAAAGGAPAGAFNSTDVARDRFMLAGSALGCAAQVARGAEPNEHGTWYYGRDGWCDGMDVKPLVWDVSAALSLDPSVVNTITYHALAYDVGGANPTEHGCGGGILLSNSLAFYAASA